ncbi:MAG: hypothetical protein FJY20_05880 [Bacteroidetes bacterium]|nr:hypothetical protein [Bacteroidota bacterium]
MHHWYAFDTVFHFAEGLYLVRYNYCRYNPENNNDLFIRFSHPADDVYRYIEIPLSRRIHLHDLNPEIRQRLSLAEVPSLQPMVMEVTRQKWKLPVR